MTLIVASAVGSTPDELYESARRAAQSGADWVEIRLDAPSGLPWDLRPYFTLPVPAIATMRHALDGGRSEAEDRARADALRRALRAGARGIDVEAWSEDVAALAKEARAEGALVIVSRHLEATPSPDVIVEMLREAIKLGADVAKLATRVNGAEDAVSLVEAARAAQREGIPCALMAVNDPFLRLLSAELGFRLVYASAPGSPPAAPGQVPVAALQPHVRRATPSSWTGRTRVAFLLGHPVAHSRSPAIQNAAFRADRIDALYAALDVAPARLASAVEALRSANVMGANVTLPHKQAVVPLLDALDASAEAAGAVNTIVAREGRLVGHNTDGAGALDALRERGGKLPGARTLLLGAGGAARGVARALVAAGADVTVTNRTAARAADLGLPTIPWDRVADVLRNVDLLVNATSVGMSGEAFPFTLERMPPSAIVLDVVTGATPLVRMAEERGLLVIRGEAMLLHQGARAFELWTGSRAPIAAMRAALEGAS